MRTIVKLPFSNAAMNSHTGKIRSSGHGLGAGMSGCGNGSVLLRTGGGGAGSSYMDMDDYIKTTGINPYKRGLNGKGLSSLSSKLQNLTAKPLSSVRKNIVMNI
jgi:hypothetical protein